MAALGLELDAAVGPRVSERFSCLVSERFCPRSRGFVRALEGSSLGRLRWVVVRACGVPDCVWVLRVLCRLGCPPARPFRPENLLFNPTS